MITKGVRKAGGRDKLGVWDKHMHIAMYETENPKRPIVQRTILNIV